MLGQVLTEYFHTFPITILAIKTVNTWQTGLPGEILLLLM